MGRADARIGDTELILGMRLHASTVRAYIKRHIPTKLNRDITPDDVLQETWTSAFQGLSGFRPEGPNAMERWLTTIAQRRLVDAIKRAASAKRGGGRRIEHAIDEVSSLLDLFGQVASPDRTPSSKAAVAEAVDAVRIALASLPPARRQALWMRYIEGRSRDTIASSMGRTSAAVNGLLFHGLEQLQERLGSAGRYLSDAASSDP